MPPSNYTTNDYQVCPAAIARVGETALGWLVRNFVVLVDEGLVQGVPDEAHQTACAEIGLLLYVSNPPARPEWTAGFAALHAHLRSAYGAPGMFRFAVEGPPAALIGQLVIRLGLGPIAGEILDLDVIQQQVALKRPAFPHTPIWKPLEMAFALDALGLKADDGIDDISQLARATALLEAADLKEPGAMYALTHLVFFGSRFGRRPVDAALRRRLGAMTATALRAACETHHVDLAAELIAASALLDMESGKARRQCWRLLMAGQADDGCFPGPAGPGAPLAEYHKCLASVMAAQFDLNRLERESR